MMKAFIISGIWGIAFYWEEHEINFLKKKKHFQPMFPQQFSRNSKDF